MRQTEKQSRSWDDLVTLPGRLSAAEIVEAFRKRADAGAPIDASEAILTLSKVRLTNEQLATVSGLAHTGANLSRHRDHADSYDYVDIGKYAQAWLDVKIAEERARVKIKGRITNDGSGQKPAK